MVFQVLSGSSRWIPGGTPYGDLKGLTAAGGLLNSSIKWLGWFDVKESKDFCLDKKSGAQWELIR